ARRLHPASSTWLPPTHHHLRVSHPRLRKGGVMKLRIILAGGSGFIGQSLSPFLVSKNYEVVVLTRGQSGHHGSVREAHWDGKTPGEWTQFVDGATAIVNLTGRSINTRHTPEHRREIVESRVDSVRVLGEAIGRVAQP